ncbi:hypothetical protein [Sulfolobus acidocaldarius]|uniref:Uncharacterized protein n=3 Tax=Sulfolobus acidocaldarius TaxID=2285 RepID=A0A0U3FSC9_9CREN|nr:hypothetical protein [Sulfolobus acidocaldarius]AGE71546.1 hypothetical protein SacN8_07930 [Sulfolobus acidocaldarius N8]AGE73819.1 hypothetical protein SacRon12I_07940 [Sulfolobus acidocaldarius Ron12/I]ALU30227.1 hypothetical protein ATY89_09945 [Sulfolobus acidocaldarius]ALU30942.1 hypothetical protein ATZ20_01500 [Sulfolobus acidocaldarius]WCM35453.1 hypothetical protein GO597_09000 [Sulfolobus acidocaldarius DSM 639]
MDRKAIYYTLIGAVPFGGSSISSFMVSRYLRDFTETLRYLPLTIGICLLTTFLITYNYLQSYVAEILVAVAVAPFIIGYVFSSVYENIKVNVSEYYIEVIFKVPVGELKFDNPSEMFNYLFSRSLKKIRPPYYQKLKVLNNCGNLRVVPRENEIVLRKKCGDTQIEIIVRGKRNVDMKVTMSY